MFGGNTCTVDETKTFPLAPFDPATEPVILLVQKKPPTGQSRRFYGRVDKPASTTYTLTCPNGPHEDTTSPNPYWFLDDFNQATEGTDGHLAGTRPEDDPNSNTHTEYTWDYAPTG
jgi:hypothetical protein